MMSTVRASEAEVYKALVELSQAIAGHSDLESLCHSLAKSLHQVVDFDALGLVLQNPSNGLLQLRVVTSIAAQDRAYTEWPTALSNPLGWVWTHKQLLALNLPDEQNRWSEFTSLLIERGVVSLVLVPLMNGDRQIGILGFGSFTPLAGDDETLAFLKRVASEFAVTVDSFLTRQELMHERDCLEVLFDIAGVLVSSLSMDDLLAAISSQLQRVVDHDLALLSVLDKATGELQLQALRPIGGLDWIPQTKSVSPQGLPSGEALGTGEPVIFDADFVRFPSPLFRAGFEAGFVSGCSIPLLTRNGACGTLELGRRCGKAFTAVDVRLLVQAGRQVAIALENSIAFNELAALKDKLTTEKLYLEGEIQSDQNFGNMIGESPAFKSVLRSIQIVAPTDATVMINGETGTGKELVARSLHELSPRANQSFIKVNCAAIPANLLESELFGHERGAFTGATAQRMGRFELAHRGTLFLDEIGEMPLELQSKLLRAIQEQEFERLGGVRTIKVDVRFIAATNGDLKQMVNDGRFRSDLYYRLHVFPLVVPPLRERREDIALLARYFTQKYSRRLKRNIERIPSAAMEALLAYDWPGNIREMQNVIERSVILSPGPELHLAIPEGVSARRVPVRSVENSLSSEVVERQNILQALKEASGRISGADGAAARLGLKRTTLQSRMKKLNIGREFH